MVRYTVGPILPSRIFLVLFCSVLGWVPVGLTLLLLYCMPDGALFAAVATLYDTFFFSHRLPQGFTDIINIYTWCCFCSVVVPKRSALLLLYCLMLFLLPYAITVGLKRVDLHYELVHAWCCFCSVVEATKGQHSYCCMPGAVFATAATLYAVRPQTVNWH